jgi:MFS family permease
VREPLVMMAIIGVLTYEFSVTLPVFVRFALHGSAAGLAALMSAMGAGAVVGGLITAGRRGDGLVRLAVTALLFGLATALVGAAPDLQLAAAAMFAVGVFSARFVGLSNGILQLRSDPAMRNRVLALWSTGFLGSTFVGAPMFGWLAQTAGPRWPLLVGALGGVLAAGVGWAGARHEARQRVARGSVVALAEKDAA